MESKLNQIGHVEREKDNSRCSYCYVGEEAVITVTEQKSRKIRWFFY